MLNLFLLFSDFFNLVAFACPKWKCFQYSYHWIRSIPTSGAMSCGVALHPHPANWLSLRHNYHHPCHQIRVSGVATMCSCFCAFACVNSICPNLILISSKWMAKHCACWPEQISVIVVPAPEMSCTMYSKCWSLNRTWCNGICPTAPSRPPAVIRCHRTATRRRPPGRHWMRRQVLTPAATIPSTAAAAWPPTWPLIILWRPTRWPSVRRPPSTRRPAVRRNRLQDIRVQVPRQQPWAVL